MKLISLALLSTIAVFSAQANQQEPFNLIHVADLKAMMTKADAKPAVFDANNADTRKAKGTIPGAKLLPGLKYDVAKTLPASKDTQLVFFCANEQCMASHSAAKRAVEAGYSKVSVLSDGIEGWAKAGEKTLKVN